MTAPAGQNPFAAFILKYGHDPVLFVREVLAAEPDPWQEVVLRDLAAGERQITVRSGHSVGKSTTAAWAALWTILFNLPVRVVVTAPSAPQLFDVFYPELLKWIGLLPKAIKELLVVKSDSVELAAAPAESFITVRTARAETPEAIAGAHAYGGKILIIIDESSGMDDRATESLVGSMAQEGASMLLLGNPVRVTGYFFDTHHKLKQSWKCYHVSSLDCSRVPKAWIEEMRLRYGAESNAYRVRVLGEFPQGDDDTVIPLDLIEAAMSREVVLGPNVPEVWGLDVARFGSDCSALCKRRGRLVPEPIKVWRNLDLMQLCGRVVGEWESLDPNRRPVEILVDAIGMGAGVVDRLRELQLPVRGINVSEAPSVGGTYRNLRAELAYKFKAWLTARDCQLPADERLKTEATSIRYKFADSSGKIQIESKDDMRRRGLDSPDVFDALALTFASDAATLMHGNRGSLSWGKALVRNIKGIV